MDRELKFRAWDKLLNKWVDPSMIYLVGDGTLRGWGDSELDSNRYAINFPTGPKDKTGRDIFEGDIVEYKVGTIKVRGVVNYSADYAVWLKGLSQNLGSYQKTTVIIGNTYDNPELV